MASTLVTISFFVLSFLNHLNNCNALSIEKRDVGISPDLPTGWSSLGCQTDSVNLRVLSLANYDDSVSMTEQSCIAFCSSHGYRLAGVEYSAECYCDTELDPSSVSAPLAECSSPCSGNATQACGGGNRINVFQLTGTTAPAAPITNPGPGRWTSLGCYNDSAAGRTLDTIGIIPGGPSAMSVSLCTASCQDGNYKYSGVEYSGECYCGNSILNGGAPASDGNAGCRMTCNGNQTEFCGGPNRVNLYQIDVPPPPPKTGWVAQGCYTDAGNGARTLAINGIIPGGPPAMSNGACYLSCGANGYTYSGTEYSGECYCGNTLDNGGAPAPDGNAKCNMPCNGNATETCGGPNRLTLYKYITAPVSSSSSSSISISAVVTGTSSSASATISSSESLSASSSASISNSASETSSSAISSIASSSSAIPTNASSSLGSANITVSASETSFSATSSSTSDFASITSSSSAFSAGPSSSSDFANITSSAFNSSSSASLSSSTSFPSATASATPTSKYQGCYQDNYQGYGRSLAHPQPDNSTMTVESCVALCKAAGYKVSGLEYTTQCFCDNIIRNGAPLAPDSDCSMPCGGNATEFCGGPNRLSVYSESNVTVMGVPKAQNESLPGSWTYQGCFTDNGAGGRAFPYQIVDSVNNSATSCLSQCSAYGFPAGGLEYGEECYCGDWEDLAVHSQTQVAESDCSTPCTGNASTICGAGNRLSAYRWTGSPLEVWSYPSGSAAGEYQFLIGGVIIPLITQMGINGKVTFVEKFGTGAANSTGAFEFDPAFSNDFDKAWRRMHVKTDVFCSASVTLPDKGGRMLNIGGWSGVSTYGVRLYTPDGSPGKTSVNDWEEDPDILSLQKGRWYPGVMVMTNGSILVVGGEDGSNGAPVPSLEILPRTGPVMELDYLKRTDPYNLYPFMTVLPSGGIGIFYYNEARILDEVTLETKTILPNIPGAVNRPLGGRTYPLEGTMMLLPQVYPYTDPLGVIVCGGSIPFEGAAIDNCASIQPDAPNPKWTIERMPSPRVLTCMTALPDGTYLILNGAKLGYAGFGLAKMPNHNAILYDPSKPVNQRMSVMANTTIDRMYHSEAILMQDGSILVSGSDPQDPDFVEEYRVEHFLPPYLLSGITPPTFTVTNKDWAYGQTVSFTLGNGSPSGEIRVSLMGIEASTHGNSYGQRTLFPQVSCRGTSCTVTAPPSKYICPPGWYHMFVLDGPTPSHSVFVRIGGDPGELGNWPAVGGFTLPGV